MNMKVQLLRVAILLTLLVTTAMHSLASSIVVEKIGDPASLDRLHDIVVPPPVSWWPLAPGWYMVASVFVLGVAWGSIRIVRHYSANQYRRQALAELKRLRELARQFGTLNNASGQVMELLKQTALVAYSRENVAALTGEAWWQFLDKTGGGSRFVESAGATLGRLTYSDPFELEASKADIDVAFYAVATWIKNHQGTIERVS